MNNVSSSTSSATLEMLLSHGASEYANGVRVDPADYAATDATVAPNEGAEAPADPILVAVARGVPTEGAEVPAFQAADAVTAEEAFLFQRVVTLNEKGIQWLQHCLYGGDSRSTNRALVLFRAALKLAQELLGHQSRPNNTNDSNAIIRDLLLREDQQRMRFETWDLDSQPTVIENVIVRPFHLLTSLTSSYSLDPLINVTISFALLMYNTGITHHVHAIMTGTQDQEVVGDTLPSKNNCSRARMLYENSLIVLEKIDIFHPAIESRSSSCGLIFPRCAVTDLLHMALYNNLCRVAYSTSDYIAATRYRHLLQSLCGYLRPRITIFYPNDPVTQGILLNCIRSLWLYVQEPYFLHEPTVASAA